MSDITDIDWQLIRAVFGDLAYEEPSHHAAMLKAVQSMAPAQCSRDPSSNRLTAEKLGSRASAELAIAQETAELSAPQPNNVDVANQATGFSSPAPVKTLRWT